MAATALAAEILLASWPFRAAAQSLLQAERDLVNFAFATQLGSGIYTVNGRTVQIYRLPFARQLSASEGARPGIRLTLPVTVGLFDFELGDILDDGVPTEFDTLSAAVGVELDFPLGESWRLLPYVEAGRAWDFHSDQDAALYTVALRVRRDFGQGERLARFSAGVVHAAVDLRGAGGHSSLFKVETGLDLRWMLNSELGGRRLDWGPYALIEWYADRPEEPVPRSATDKAIPLQAEIGFTFGTRPRARLWGIPLPRLGLAYRFGERLSAYRVVFGAPF